MFLVYPFILAAIVIRIKSGVWVRIKYVTITASRSAASFHPNSSARRRNFRRGAEYGDGGIGYDPETMATSQPVSDTNRCSTASGGQVL